MIVSKSRDEASEPLAGEDECGDLFTVLAEQDSVMLLGTFVHEGEFVPECDWLGPGLFLAGLISSMSW